MILVTERHRYYYNNWIVSIIFSSWISAKLNLIPCVYRRALKATFVLIPLFGLHLFLVIYRPIGHGVQGIYEVISTVIINSQVGPNVRFQLLESLLSQQNSECLSKMSSGLCIYM